MDKKKPSLILEGTYHVVKYEDEETPFWYENLDDAYDDGDAPCVIYRVWVGAVIDVKRA